MNKSSVNLSGDKINYKLIFMVIALSGVSLLVLLTILIRQYKVENQVREERLTVALNETVRLQELVDDWSITRENIESMKQGFDAWEKRRLASKRYRDMDYYAYQLLPDEFVYKGTGVMTPYVIRDGNDNVYVLSNYHGTSFTTDRIFDIFQDQIYSINMQNNSIDIYTLAAGSSLYEKSIKLPSYKTGTLYGVYCELDTCTVKTAFHQESGCDIELNLLTDSFGVPECTHYDGGTFTPED